jgi:hypothetical protein
MHKAVDQIKFDKDAAKLILTGAIDDVIPLLSDSRRKEIEQLRIVVNSGFTAMLHALTNEYIQILKEVNNDRKAFALRVKDHKHRGIMFALAFGDGDPVYEYIMKQTNGIKSWDDCYRELKSFLDSAHAV